MKNLITFKGDVQKRDISRKLNFAKFTTYETLIYQNDFHRLLPMTSNDFLEGTRKARK